MAASRDLGGDPPESTRLRIGDDIAWSDVSGVFDRDDSLKENTNPKCLVKNHPCHNGNGSSQRFPGNLKPTAAPIIGIPGNLGQGGGCARRHHPPAMFPKKAKTGGGGRNPKPAVPEHEPSSPKVSCIGKVISDRESAPPATTEVAGDEVQLLPRVRFLIRHSRSRKSAVECVDWSPPPPPAAAERRREAAPPPGLGGMRRFSSGRRAADWAAEMEVDGRVARSGPL